jgi:hypothetical protein
MLKIMPAAHRALEAADVELGATRKSKPTAHRDMVAAATVVCWLPSSVAVAGVGVVSTAMDSQAANEISHEIHGSYGPAFFRNIRFLGWDHPYFLVTNQTHVYHVNVVRQGGDTGAQPASEMDGSNVEICGRGSVLWQSGKCQAVAL